MFSFDFLQWLFCLGQITLIGGAVLLAGRFLIRRSPDVASLVSALALVAGCLLVVSTGLDIPKPWSIQSPDDTVGLVAPVPLADSPADSSSSFVDAAPAADSRAAGAGVSAGELFTRLKPFLFDPTTAQHRLGRITFHAAILCCILLAIRLLVGVFALAALRWKSQPLEDDSLQEQLAVFQSRLQLEKLIRIRVYSGIDSPCVSWLSPSIIFVPQEFEAWSEAEKNASLAHELGHIKRSDPLWRLAAELAWTFVCWHPLMWKIRQQLVLAQEMSADQLAAVAQGNGKAYQKGLSLLALRLDSLSVRKQQNIYFLGMSVSSSSLIRRIKMLQGLKTNEIKSSMGKRGAAMVASLLLFGWLGCWSVQAQTTQQQTDDSTQPPVAHVAKNTNAAPAARAPFTRAVDAPWTSMGQTKGYVSIRVADLLEHPIHSKTLPALWEQIPCLNKKADGTRPSLSDAGLPFDSITRVTSTLQPHFSRTDEKQTVAWTIGKGGVVIQTNKDIDWPKLVGNLDLSSFLPPDNSRDLAKKLANSATVGTKLHLSQELMSTMSVPPPSGDVQPVEVKPAEVKPADSPKRAIEAELWNFVGGGVMTLMSDVTLLHKTEADEDQDELEQLYDETALMVQTVALGIDIGDANQEEVRIAVEPSEGTSARALAAKVQQLLKIVADELETGDEPHSAHAFRQLEVQVQETDSGSFVTITGQLPWLHLIGNVLG